MGNIQEGKMKQCTKCLLFKPLSTFDLKKKRINVYYKRCKRCNSKYSGKSRKKKPVCEYDPVQLLEALCFHLNTTKEEMISPESARSISIKRHVIMYLVFRFTTLSLKATAQLLGKKDHTSVMYAIHKVIGFKQTYRDFYNSVRTMQRSLRKNDIEYLLKEKNKKHKILN